MPIKAVVKNGKDIKIPEYPFLVQSKDGEVFFIHRYTDGKCSPCVASQIPCADVYTSHNFKEEGFESSEYRLFEGELVISNKDV